MSAPAPSGHRRPTPTRAILLGALVGGLVVASVTFMITWLLLYPGDPFGGSPSTAESAQLTTENDDIVRDFTTMVAASVAGLGLVVGASAGAVIGWIAHTALLRQSR
ncbi:hypothetical protein [Gordonia insulae]|nr:hypothetical protein [Gordonia insulae]